MCRATVGAGVGTAVDARPRCPRRPEKRPEQQLSGYDSVHPCWRQCMPGPMTAAIGLDRGTSPATSWVEPVTAKPSDLPCQPTRSHRTRDRCRLTQRRYSKLLPHRPPARLGKHRSDAAVRHTPDVWRGSGLQTRKRRPQGSAFSRICRHQTTACRNYSAAAAAAAAALAEALAAAAAAMSSLMRAALPSRPRR